MTLSFTAGFLHRGPCWSKSLLRKGLSCKRCGKRWTRNRKLPHTKLDSFENRCSPVQPRLVAKLDRGQRKFKANLPKARFGWDGFRTENGVFLRSKSYCEPVRYDLRWRTW